MRVQVETVKDTEEQIWGFNFVNGNEQSDGYLSGVFFIMCVSKIASQVALMQMPTASLLQPSIFCICVFLQYKHDRGRRENSNAPNQAGVTIFYLLGMYGVRRCN